MIVGLDFETYSDVDLKVHGTDRYVSSPHFRVLMAAVKAIPYAQSAGLDPVQKGVVFDFIEQPVSAMEELRAALARASLIVVHNASFELAVLEKLGIEVELHSVIDTAVLAREAGGSPSLAKASRQFCPAFVKDGSAGDRLIPIFCTGEGAFDESIVQRLSGDWQAFKHYCLQDVLATLELFCTLGPKPYASEFEQLTRKMNQRGWPVNMELVNAMQDRYEVLKAEALTEFRDIYDPKETLNFNSPKQIVAWAAARGVKLRSTNEAAVENALARLEKKLKQLREDPVAPAFMSSAAADEHTNKLVNYAAVQRMLKTKQLLGGSSLKKLQKIIDTVGEDNRLRNQYLHYGAAQTGRTSGVGVQLQNLKRFTAAPLDVSGVAQWSIEELQDNLRQVFAPHNPDGHLIVGDFSSVEARALVWVAGESRALDAYQKGEDLYKLTASSIFNTPVVHIDKGQRQVGKVAVLSCGYGAGSATVKEMAASMGLTLSAAEADKIVYGWREANPQVVELWAAMERAFRHALIGATADITAPDLLVSFDKIEAPSSLGKGVSIEMRIEAGSISASRVFHGVYLHGTEIRYHKPTQTKEGKLWTDVFKNPKTKRWEHYRLYGGKLTGILIQSLCREIFGEVAASLEKQLPIGFSLIGQFHDELVIEQATGVSEARLNHALKLIEKVMSTTQLAMFPLAAEIKFDHRYTK